MKLNKGGAEDGGRLQGKQRKRRREEVFLLVLGCWVSFVFVLCFTGAWARGGLTMTAGRRRGGGLYVGAGLKG